MPSKIALSITILAAAMGMANAAPHNSEFNSFNAGHNVASTNENKLVDASDITVLADVLKRGDKAVCKKYISSYNKGHNVYNFNKNTLVDLSDATLDLEILSGDGVRRFYHGVPKSCVTYIKSYNGGHNVVSYNDNTTVDASDLAALINILKRHNEFDPYFHDVEIYNGGHNVESTNENKLVDTSGITIGADVLRRNAPSFSKYNGGHNVESTNENKLIDLSNLTALVSVLKRDLEERTGTKIESINGGHNVESTNENKLIDLSKLTALISILKRDDKSYTLSAHARDIMDDVFRRTNDDEDCTYVKKPKKPVVNKPKPEECAPFKTKTWTKNRTQVHTLKPTPPSCRSDEIYINKGHNVVSTNENKLIDFSDITINLSILDLGKKESKTVKGDATCQSEYGCCVSKTKYYYDGGHNVQSTNENKLLDLSGLNLGIDLL